CRTSMDGGDGLSTGSALACLRRGVLHLSQEDTKVLGGRMATAMAEWRPRTAEGPAVALAGTTIAFRLADGPTYTAVERASLAVADGEFVAIVGPTGCGKSTLLNVAAGLLAPSEGAASIYGRG